MFSAGSKALKAAPTPGDEFEKLLYVLNIEASSGRMHLEIARRLSIEATERPDALQCAQVFFVLTFRAHLESAYLRAARLFDETAGTASLHSIPKAAEVCAGKFQFSDASDVRAKILSWQAAIVGSKPTVAKLRDLRNALIAHLDKKVILDPVEMARTVAVTFNEVDQLLEVARTVIRGALVAYNNALYIDDLLSNDVEAFFQAFNHGLKNVK
jgi:AbiU2